MSSARQERLKELVGEALLRPAEEREAYLRASCADDPALLAEALELVAHYEEHGPFDPPEIPEEVRHGVIPTQVGAYVLLRKIGQGGYGSVFEARRRGSAETVAVKILLIGLTTPPDIVARFRREPQTIARVAHPSIVRVLDAGEAEGLLWFAMEFFPRGNLASEVERQHGRKADVLLPPFESPEYVRACAQGVADLADGLQRAHEIGVVHRDVKPANILVGDDGRLKLADFGISRDASQGQFTTKTPIRGTTHYESPEQAQVIAAGVDERTDVYSLGVVLYEMLTLRRPFTGESDDEVRSKIRYEDPPPIGSTNPRVARDLITICGVALRKDKRDRYASAGELADDLRRFLRGEAIHGRPLSIARRAKRLVQRHRFLATVAVTLLSALLVLPPLATRMAQAQQRAEELSRLRALDGEEEWAELEDSVLAGSLALLRSDAPSGADEAELWTRLGLRFERLHLDWKTRARQLIDGARPGAAAREDGEYVVEADDAIDDSPLIDGLLLATRAFLLFPEDAELARLTSHDLFDARVSLSAVEATGMPVPGTAAYRALDPVTGLPGERVVLGPLPLVEHAVPPGFYRFSIELADGSFFEYTRLLAHAEVARPIVCRVRPERDPLAGMVRIEGGTHWGPPGEWSCPFVERDVPVASFFLDATEVSIGEYLEFLTATCLEPPSEWPEEWKQTPPDASLRALPAVGVNWFEARAYAEWAGKRLVSHAEWERAAFLDGPWEAPSPNVHGQESRYRDGKAWFLECLVGLQPVRAPGSLGSHGLYHMLGNAYEWTESLGYRSVGDQLTFMRDQRVILSSPWYAASRPWPLEKHRLWEPYADNSHVENGFRCARSERP